MKVRNLANPRLLALALLAAGASAQSTTRASVNSQGVQAMGGGVNSNESVISGDGKFVAFNSLATNLVPNDTNGRYDVFVHNRQTGATDRISLTSGGAEIAGASTSPSISSDGRYVIFYSLATGIVAGDTNATTDIFVRDRTLGTTVRASISSASAQANGPSVYARISGNGQFVVFSSTATNLVGGDSNVASDIFVRDLVAGTTTRVSVATGGTQSNGDSYNSSISNDGRYVAFSSGATNLVAGDTNVNYDVFIHDRNLTTTARASVTSIGGEANNYSDNPAISGDGRYVAYTSPATNIVAGDTNAVADIFRYDRTSGAVVRISLNSLGVQGNASSSNATLSLDGRYVVFRSNATNLVTTDANAQPDIFRRDALLAQTTLASVDSAGNQANSYTYCGGYGSSVSSDGRYVTYYGDPTNLVAGDTNGDWDVFVRDTLATGRTPVTAYCIAKINSAGCVPSIGSAGLPSISGQSTLFITATNVINQKNGIFFWGTSQTFVPFYGGTLCVNTPIVRTPLQASGGSAVGNDCTGTYSFSFNAAYITSHGLVAGSNINGQYWSRDPLDPQTVGLTDALHCAVCP